MFDAVMSTPSPSMMWKARDRGLLDFVARATSAITREDKHRQVDDTPYGGGWRHDSQARCAGARDRGFAVKGDSDTPVILLSPQGRKLTHAVAAELSRQAALDPGLRALRGRRRARARAGDQRRRSASAIMC